METQYGQEPEVEESQKSRGFVIKEVKYLARGKKSIDRLQVPREAMVSGEIKKPELTMIPKEEEEVLVVVEGVSEEGQEGELSSKPAAVSRERTDDFNSMDLMTLKQEMARIGGQYRELKEVKDGLESIIKSYQERIDNNLKLQAEYKKLEDDARQKELKESVEELQARRKELQEKLEQIQKNEGIKKKELLDWRKSSGDRFQLLEAEWNMLGDLIRAKKNIEEAA